IILVPLNTRLSAPELEVITGDCRPAAMVVDEELLDCFEALRPRLDSVRLFLHIGKPFPGAISYEGLAGKYASLIKTQAVEDDVNCILYTGGTTGFPKGAELTNGTWLANHRNTQPVLGITEHDVNLVMTPLFHTAAVWPAWLHLGAGGVTVTTRRFDVRETLEVMERERITFCHPVLSQVVSLIEAPYAEEYDLSRLRIVQCSMSLPAPAFERARRVFRDTIMPGYGLTEAGPMATLMPLEEMRAWEEAGGMAGGRPRRYSSSGKILPNVEVRLVDDADREVPCGEVGEITVRSEAVMKGYWERPEATAQSLRNGWLHTGDLARMDEDGFMYFVDRKSGMIKTGGESVYPKEVEDAIAAHPSVLEASVFGLPHARWGETVMAVVALRQGASATAEDLIEHCRHRIASYKKPTAIDFVDSLPRNPSGKVIKAELRKRYISEA
ncbi:MAG: AMP-binding protein, partial [Dehalococcoidia bacterium]|nr:AMP-binding protein [Dehalococcoidia bacterium]